MTHQWFVCTFMSGAVLLDCHSAVTKHHGREVQSLMVYCQCLSDTVAQQNKNREYYFIQLTCCNNIISFHFDTLSLQIGDHWQILQMRQGHCNKLFHDDCSNLY